MDLFEKNQDLTPFKLSLSILLYESLTNTTLSSIEKTKTLSFIVKHIQSSPSSELSYSDLMSSLSHLPNSQSILQSKITSMADFSDVLHLFIVKLNELKSDGDISTGNLEQGGILYLFLRKCFVSFARMGFEDLVSLSNRLQTYKQNKPLPVDSYTRASRMASSLDQMLLNSDYTQIERELNDLNLPSKYLILGHLDASYQKNSSVDNIHRYFDLVLDQQMPTKTTREKGLVVVQSSTHFASLHRVKIELQLGHLKAAVHLLVETIKRALSENDNLVILESNLLFMKIASLMGNYRQEMRIAQKAVIHGLKVGNTNALIKTCLFYAQLALSYVLKDSAAISAEIQPKITEKKGVLPVKKMNFSKDEKTWVKLCDYMMLECLLSHECKGVYKNIEFVSVVNWVNQGIDWYLNIENMLSGLELNIEEVNFLLDLSREVFKHDRETSVKILRKINENCKVKNCVQWDYSLAFVLHSEALKNGEFLNAEYFESVAELSGKEHDVKLMKLQRITQQRYLKEAFELSSELIDYYSSQGLAAKTCEARLLLSQVYFYSQEYFRALSELSKSDELIKEFRVFEIPYKIQLAESSLLAFENPVIAMNILNSIENKIFYRKSCYQLGKFFKCKAKVALALAGKTRNQDIFEKAIELLTESKKQFELDRNAWEVREVNYLIARVFDKTGDIEKRKFWAEEFCRVNKILNVGSKATEKVGKFVNLTDLMASK